jgi:hypothetical protein
MWKAVCIAFVPLIGLSVLLSLKPTTLAAPAKSAVSLTAESPPVVDDVPQTSSAVSNKSDKLTPAAKSVPVQTIRVTPIETPPPVSTKSKPEAREITHWHWHVGSKIKRRTAVQD